LDVGRNPQPELISPMTLRVGALLLLLLTVGACDERSAMSPPAGRVVTTASGLQLEPVTFADLPDWNRGPQSEALLAFRRSCGRLTRLPMDAPMGPGGFAGQASDWLAACRAADIVGSGEDDGARSFFQNLFRPYRLSDPARGDEGLLTGYYLPRVKGARQHAPGFEVPLYRRPPDLVASGPNDGKVGRLVDGKIRPYYTRAEIDAGALAGQSLELVWLANSIDAFFVSIQGSAEVKLPEGTFMRIGVAGSNGQPYVAIGRLLIDQGEIRPEDMSMQSLAAWLSTHPERARDLMERNPRYIFFREVPGEGPVGAEGVVLTAGRSLAVDPAFLPLGAPVFLDSFDAKGSPWRRLMLAQDSGTAIKGPLRGDVYWGGGEMAENSAGAMKSPSRFYLLLPIGVIPTAGG
jgi:membrane-bound lytic murein transglycosylase A